MLKEVFKISPPPPHTHIYFFNIQAAEIMTEQELYDLLSALNLYTSVFHLFIVLCFIAFITILLILIHNIKKRKLLKENRAFISEIIQTQEEERKRISQELHDTISLNIKTLLVEQKEFLSYINGTSGHVPNEDTSLIKIAANHYRCYTARMNTVRKLPVGI